MRYRNLLRAPRKQKALVSALCLLSVTGCASPQALLCPMPPSPPDALMTAPEYPKQLSTQLESPNKTPTK